MAEIYDYSASADDIDEKNAWFASIIGSGRRVLEVGCATGYVGEHLARHLGCSVVGIEINDTAVAKARARLCYEDVLVGDIQDPTAAQRLPSRAFDFVLFGDVLEHLVRPEWALANVRGLLADEGQVLICVPNIVHWSIRWRVLMGRFDYEESGTLDRTHLRFFTPKSIHDLVVASDYRIVREGGVVWLPRPMRQLPSALRRTVERASMAMMPDLMIGQTLLAAVRRTA